MKKKIVEVDEDVLKDIIVGVFPYLAISLIALIFFLLAISRWKFF